MKRVLLGLGSNRAYKNYSSLMLLSFAGKEISKILSNCVFSSVYKTKAMYYENQDDFYNMVILGYVNDEKNPFELLKEVNQIEAKYGRNRTNEIRNGPRSLDIDIELFGDETISSAELEIPHKRLSERAFVLIPAVEILTNSADEIIRKKFIDCLEKLKQNENTDNVQKIYSFEKAEYGTDKRYCGNTNNNKTCI